MTIRDAVFFTGLDLLQSRLSDRGETLMPEDELLSAPQVAAILQISEEAVTRAIRQGRLAATRCGRQWIIRRADLGKWKRKQAAS